MYYPVLSGLGKKKADRKFRRHIGRVDHNRHLCCDTHRVFAKITVPPVRKNPIIRGDLYQSFPESFAQRFGL